MTTRTTLAGLGLAFITSAAVLACGAPGTSPEGVGSTSSAASTAFPNDQTAYEFFVGKGLTSFQAAGIVGNLDQESGVDPGAVQAGGPGRGIAQWSVGGRWDTDTNDNVLWYAGTQGESSGSLTLQLEFIWYELTTFSGYGLASLQGSTNVTDATIAFETDFEGCGTCDQSTRISYAESVLAAYGTTPDYAAAYVSQSFPLASSALTITAGDTVAASITMKNTGGKSWDSNTHLGTTQPRDRDSVFADSSWLSANRPAGVTGTVAPGDQFTFEFSFHAPSKPGTYFEYFNLVEEGVAWFSDPGQGGPPDNDLEAQIVVLAGPDAGTSGKDDDAGGGASSSGGTAGGSSGSGGELDDAGSGGGAGLAPTGAGPGSGLDPSGGGASGAGSAPSSGSTSASGSCAVTAAPARGGSGAWLLALSLALLRRRRAARLTRA